MTYVPRKNVKVAPNKKGKPAKIESLQVNPSEDMSNPTIDDVKAAVAKLQASDGKSQEDG